MRWNSTKLLAIAVAVAEIASVGLAATSAPAQSATRQEIARQQRLIQQQQRQIREYQRQLAAQQQPAPQEEGGFLLGCPRGYSYSLFGKGCYPNLPAPIVITNPRY